MYRLLLEEIWIGEIMKGLSLFSGIGGLDLAFEWAGGEVVAMCEIDPYCQKVLRKHWPKIPIFGNVKELKGSDIKAVEIIYGGFPCQPFSFAGRRKGKGDDRYLWPEFSRLVREIKPRWIVAENVAGILRIAADDVCSDLESQGYEVGIFDYEAAAVGAKHRRERVFFVANSSSSRSSQTGKSGRFGTPLSKREFLKSSGSGSTFSAEFLSDSWKSEPRMDRVVDGIPHRLDRLKALGNAVVPQQVYPIFKAIFEAENEIQKK